MYLACCSPIKEHQGIQVLPLGEGGGGDRRLCIYMTLYVYTGCEIGGRQVAQATCKRSVVTYFDQLVAIPGDLRICSSTLRYSHTTTHIARLYTFS